LTSGLLNLFENRPDELAFVVGRELGHLRCGHDDLYCKAYTVLAALRSVDPAVVPDRFREALPVLPLGRLFTWSREAEFSADRAGLVACRDPKIAYQAIMRLQSGLRADSTWLDPDAGGFDADAIVRSFRQWEAEPLLRFVHYIKEQPADHPYYQERLAMLKLWADAGAYRAPPDDAPDPGSLLIEVVRIEAFELAGTGETVDPYVVVWDGDGQVLRTHYASGVREAAWWGFRSNDRGVDQPRAFADGRPLFCEIWDADYGTDTLIGGFVIYPDSRRAEATPEGGQTGRYTARIRWDWREPRAVGRSGFATVQVRFTRRPTTTTSTSGEPKR
jgi:hypothetical protein